jgi:5'-nucleotidase
MKRILICNDDGYRAQGIRRLRDELLRGGFEVYVVAPHEERSGQSHAMSFFSPVHVQRIDASTWAVKGTPADCAAIALLDLLKDRPPHLVISGINHGYNLGWDVHYSGTVGAATEASFLGTPAVAVSMNCMGFSEPDLDAGFRAVGALMAKLAHEILNPPTVTWPSKCVLNINHPGIPGAAVAIAHCRGDSIYNARVQRFVLDGGDPGREHAVYILGGNSFRGDGETVAHGARDDVSLAYEGKATMTMLSFRQGHHASDDLLGTLWQKLTKQTD